MTAHIWVDLESGLARAVTTTPANAGDVTEVDKAAAPSGADGVRRCGLPGADKQAPKRGHTGYIAAKPVPSPLHHIRIPDLGIFRAFSGTKPSAFQARFRDGCLPA